MKKFLLLILFFLAGCNEPTVKKEIKFDEIMVAHIKIVAKKEVKEWDSFKNLIIEDDKKEYLGFVAIVDGELKWKSYKGCTYLIENSSLLKERDEKKKQDILRVYYEAEKLFVLEKEMYERKEYK